MSFCFFRKNQRSCLKAERNIATPTKTKRLNQNRKKFRHKSFAPGRCQVRHTRREGFIQRHPWDALRLAKLLVILGVCKVLQRTSDTIPYFHCFREGIFAFSAGDTARRPNCVNSHAVDKAKKNRPASGRFGCVTASVRRCG